MKFPVSPFGKLLTVLALIPAGIYGLYKLYADVPEPKQPDVYGLRPCFEEEIRLEAARFWLSQQQRKPADIEYFNRLVDAHNQPCAHRMVSRRGMFGVEAVHSEVRANRDALWAEGIARFQGR
ncbi:hypothetical protein ACVWWO_000408 [Bradyrhizobium sp. F1.13.1]|jgi:hypothetical protein